MNAELKKRWLEALRSGDYKQSSNYLRKETGFCCLGVLCDLADPKTWEPEDEGLTHLYVWSHGYYKYYTTPPTDLIPGPAANKCMNLNDQFDQTFDQIADWLEKNMNDDGTLREPTP